jgi:alanine racemase
MFPGRPTYAEIDLDALRHNFMEARRLAGEDQKLLGIVKADAYGHGAIPVALALERMGADFIGVAITEEGVQMRRAGIKTPILLLGGDYPGQETVLFKHHLTPILFDLETARRLDAAARQAGVIHPYHLKIDTGMGRVGFQLEELSGVLPVLRTFDSLRMEGIISHFCVSDVPGDPFTEVQRQRFREALALVRGAGFEPDFRHIGNSAALLTLKMPECNMLRPGVILYGASPSAAFRFALDLHPVMHLRTTVVQVRHIPEGASVSYGRSFIAARPTTLAAIPVGYADGYSRRLSNCGDVLIHGRRARVAGKVCMDWTLIDVTDIPDVRTGDVVTLLGRDGEEEITADEWADKIGTISYEVFCQISKRVPRLYRGMGMESVLR